MSNPPDFNEKSDKIIDKEKNFCDCDKKFGIVQKIVYNTDSNLVKIPFSSVCVKCGLCLIIADKINETLTHVHDTMSPHVQWLNDTEADNVLRSICNEFFYRYRLRETNGERYIGENLPGATLIELSDNKLWEFELKNKCIELIQNIGTTNVYKYWLKWFLKSQNTSLATIFCRSNGGIFSDCRNFEESQDKKYFSQNEDSSQRKMIF
ncbi:uncharacterized protein [Chelonus insularis]|uniref:uncharacterized protein n=1 Tax=Chelonus insularis TaxID=460826 RepID=UPI00158BC17E|nr:uncharacterized protein LOC118070012 [Chelonus insularis]